MILIYFKIFHLKKCLNNIAYDMKNVFLTRHKYFLAKCNTEYHPVYNITKIFYQLKTMLTTASAAAQELQLTLELVT